MNTPEKKSEAQQIKELLLHWLKYWYIFAISIFVVGILGGIYYITAKRVYQVTGSVTMRHDESIMGAASASRAQSLMSSFGLGKSGGTNIEDEALKMHSQDYIKRVVKKFDLNKVYTQKEFLGLIKTDLYEQTPISISTIEGLADTLTVNFTFSLDIKPEQTSITMKLGRKTIGKYNITSFPATINTKWGDYTFNKTECFDNYPKPLSLNILFGNYDYITQAYRQNLSIDFEKKTSDIIHLSMENENVNLSKKILNEIISVYNQAWLADKNLVSEKTLDYLDERLALTEEALTNADLKVKQFKNQYDLTEIEADVAYYFTSAGEIQAELLKIKSQLAMIDVISEFIENEDNKYTPFPFTLSISELSISEVLKEYNKQLSLRNDSSKEEQSSRAKSLDKSLEEQRLNIIQSLKMARKEIQATLTQIEKKDAEIMKKLGSIPSIEKDYIGLRRDQEIQQTIYIFLREMREETGVKGVNILPKLQTINAPYKLTKPVSPSLAKTAVIIIFVGGIFIPLAIIYTLPILKNRFRRRK
ncbi:hypothetical protein LJC06_03330 [Bacteroidales bacterium OttesenSCG-928-I14]|nr:hypothetical protein [Bacteroidales bacterium OttesenSCG-928-I14]